MSAPGETRNILSVKSELSKAKPAAQELNSAFEEATNQMKPEPGRVQAATQVKGLSSENITISEADPIHLWGRQNSKTVNGEVVVALTESETVAWNQEDDPGTWETQGVVQELGLWSDKP